MRINACIILLGLMQTIDVTWGRLNSASFWFYTGSQRSAVIFDLSHGPAILRHRLFNVSWPTVLYVHGWNESASEESCQHVLGAYSDRGGYNTILLNWEHMASDFYPKAMMGLSNVGARVADALLDMFDRGLAVESFHIVGYSLGAQLSGHIGRYIISRSQGKYLLPRITGLDPAGPFFYPPLISNHMTPHDATLVDVIHTDGGFLGTPMATGSVDFWPNSGVRCQPGCELDSIPVPLSTEDRCSHSMAWRFWAESVRSSHSKAFLAVPARSWFHFISGFVGRQFAIPMGINCPNSAQGNMYLQTNRVEPYARGHRGVHYIEMSKRTKIT